ncbi:MAG TPA: VWA domain-containing protein [Thermoanaerobaculia bacterium]
MRKTALALVALLALQNAAGALAEEKPAAKQSAEKKKLTRAEKKERMAKLPDKHREWYMAVEPIILPDEIDTFLRLETDAQRDLFIEDFWRRRDIAQGTTNHAFKRDYEIRVDFARSEFGQLSSDRSRLWLLHGEPTARWQIDKCTMFQPMDIWYYRYLEAFRQHDIYFLFYQPYGHRDYRLWIPIGPNAMSDLRNQDPLTMGSRGLTGNPILDCKDGEYIAAAIGRMTELKDKMTRIYEPPKLMTEDVKAMTRSLVIATHGAPKLPVELSVSYPAGDGNRTDAQVTILVPRSAVKANDVTGVPVYSIDVIGEVLRNEQLYEKFRYRFDFPADTQDANLPVILDRLLRPGTYAGRFKIVDVVTTAEAIVEKELIVPAIEVPAELKVAKTEATAAIDDIRRVMDARETRLRIVPLPEDALSGLQTIETLVTGPAVKGVEFWLDGRKVATRRQPPYTLDLDFGNVPRLHKVRAVALNAAGEALTGDEIVVNTGTDPFRVRIASPRVAPKISGPTRVEIDVRIPQGKELASVDLFWNEQRVATLFDPPFIHTVNIPKSEGVGYLRAVAALKDDETTPVEDMVFVNTPQFMEEVNVHLVELPTTVLGADGKPRNDLTAAAFQVLDEGKPVKIEKFEQVKNLPLSIGMAVDTSGSMESRMAEAQKAGAAFFKNVMEKGDKAFLVAFDSQPHVVQKWSPNLTDMQGALAKLRPEESTALYDAIVYSLYNFIGVRGQKALVLLTDGKDTVSKFTYDQAVEYARRAAVPVYVVGLGIRTTEMDTRSKLNRIATETGGNVYYIENAGDLGKIYDDIQNELRSQYVLGFYPPAEIKAGGAWRELTVKVTEGRAKTIRGYYP